MKKLLLFALAALFACNVHAQPANTQDSLALVDIFNQLNGDPPAGAGWRTATNWLSKKPLGEWYGVVVVNGRVTELHLAENWMEGNLPGSMTNLTALTFLDMHGDDYGIQKLHGTPALASLVNLTYIDLSHNQLKDSTLFYVRNLPLLTDLNLSFNGLSGDMPTLNALVNLVNLDLSHNSFTNNIPITLTNITSLKSIHFEFNKLTGAVPGGFSNLQYYNLQNNLLTGDISPLLGTLSNLQYLNFQNNQLTGNIPPSLGNISSLQYIYLQNNQLAGSIPAGLFNNTGLKEINLSNNKLTGDISPSAGNLSMLMYLNLRNNALTGGIFFLGNLTHLSYIDLSYNQLSGAIPPFIINSDYPFISYLSLSHNNFSGSIPHFQGSVNARLIDLSYNQLTDSIPTQIFPASVANFNLSHNQLTGPIPRFRVGFCTDSFNVSYNQLTGVIPQSLFKTDAMVRIYLNNNYLSGNLLNLFTRTINKLQILDISNNRLTGTIPAAITQLPGLTQFNFQNNQLSGSLTPLAQMPLLNGKLRLAHAWLWGNHFNFTDVEDVIHKVPDVRFNPQTLPLDRNGYQLSIAAGGILSHNRYEWYRDSTLVSSKTGDSVFTAALPGKYNVVVTDVQAVANGQNIKIMSDTVFQKIAVITINAVPDSASCIYANKPVTFTAAIVYGGTAPTFQWMINGVKVKKTTQPLYTTTDLKNNDTVRCILTSNADSVLYNVVTSNYIKMAITTIARYRDTLFGCNMLVYKGVTYRGSTEVYDTLRNTRGCDSVYTITTIKIRKVKAVAKDTAIAACNKVVYKGITYKTSTVLRDTLRDTYGCDSMYNTATITVLTKPAPLSAITGPTSVLRGQIGIQYSVTPVSGITYYWLVKNATITAGQGTNKITVTWGNASGGVSAYAINTCDTSNVSHIVVSANSSFAGNSVALQASSEQTIAGVVKLYPNPTANTANLQLQGARGRVTVEITDLMGKKLWQQDKVTASTLALPVENLPAGIYMVTVKDNTGQVTLKLEKIK